MTTSATDAGSPMCPFSQRRIDGPSLSRKKVLKTAKESVKSSDVRPLIPSATPLRSVLPMSGTAFLMSLVNLAASLEFTPASLSALSIFEATVLSAALISCDCEPSPPSTISTISTPIATRPSRTIAAPRHAARGGARAC